VARCGSEQVALRLPYPELVNGKKLRRENPRVWALWNLAHEVQQRAFGRNPFGDLSEDQDWQLQVAGSAFVPQLLSGRFDQGFAGRSFNPANYHGPVKSQPQKGKTAPGGTVSLYELQRDIPSACAGGQDRGAGGIAAYCGSLDWRGHAVSVSLSRPPGSGDSSRAAPGKRSQSRSSLPFTARDGALRALGRPGGLPYFAGSVYSPSIESSKPSAPGLPL
jgi:hypothetical protein